MRPSFPRPRWPAPFPGLLAVMLVLLAPPLRAEPAPSPISPRPLRAEATRYPRDTPDLRIRFPAGFAVTEAPNGAVLAAPADSSFLMTLFPAPDARDARVAASAAQELIGYLRLATKLDLQPTEEIRTVSGQVFYLIGAAGKDLLGKDIFYEVAVGTPEDRGEFFYAVAAIYPTEAARKAHTAEFRESVRSIQPAGEDPDEPTGDAGPARN